MPSTPARLTMSRSLAKVISASRADDDSRPQAHFAFATDRSVGMLQYYEPTTAGHREATVFGSSMVIDVVIADP
jgi:hypothetical protein